MVGGGEPPCVPLPGGVQRGPGDRASAAQHARRDQRSAPAERWDLPEFHPEVLHAVRSLSVRQRAVIVLTYWADLAPADVADRLGISEGSVRRHLARA